MTHGRTFAAWLLLISLVAGVPKISANDAANENGGDGTGKPAPEVVRLYYLALPGLIEREGKSGPVAHIVQEIGDRAQITFDMRYMVMNRMIRELQGDVPAVGVPQLGALVPRRYKKKMRLSPPIVFRRDYSFVRFDTDIPRSIKDIKKMVLVVSPMTTLPPPLRALQSLTVIETHSDASALSLVSAGRADLWVNDATTTMAAIQKADVHNIKYDATRPFFVWPAHMVYSVALSDRIAGRIDAAILSMAEDGTLRKYLPHNFVQDYTIYLDKQPVETAFTQH